MSTYRSTYTGRYIGIGKLLQRPGVQQATAEAAQRMLRIARFLSPVGDPAADPHPGQYRESFEVRPIIKNVPFRGKSRMRAGSRLVNTAGHARAVEYGNGKVQRYAVLRTAIDAARVNDG
ncbi:hypothetical protein [Kitasatospora sp. NPDC101183]|uniref:hypothetical protein n=1 Tax=Kitasatospora sp. NPDC101183 TaxID=3364100 RepID=UPI0037F589BD